MKIHSIIPKITSGCALAMIFSPAARAEVSDADFDALKNLVVTQGQQIDALQKTNNLDQQHINSLQQQLGQTQTTANNAEQKAEAAGQVQPVFPPPGLATSATHNFSMVGDAEVQFGKTSGQHSTFALADFAPIFLFRANDNVLFEAGFDVTLGNNTDANDNRAAGSSTTVSMSFGQLDYLMNDYVTLCAGDILLPLGTYSERAAGWLNKIPDDPLIRDWLPGSGVGIEFRGAVPMGDRGQLFNYSLYGVNGPSSSSITNGASAGDLDLGGNVGDTPNWHANPSAGGRIAYFYPWKVHYDFELGISGQSGQWSDTGNHLWSAFVVDAALHRNVAASFRVARAHGRGQSRTLHRIHRANEFESAQRN
jgi:hypothetical protein